MISVNSMKWLVRREMWEHRGAFFWAPIVVAAIMVALLIGGLITAAVVGVKAGFQIGGVEFRSMMQAAEPEMRAEIGRGLAQGMHSAAGPILMVFSVVAFFYCIGALYTERRDRSILFWKSLPISDTEAVLSKVLLVLVVAPLIALAVATVLHLAIVLILVVVAAGFGVNLVGAVLGSPEFYIAPLRALALLPLYMLWALPAVGWLMLCSVWSRSVPFLWAVALPVGAGVLLAWFNALFGLGLAQTWYWKAIAGRVLLSVAPGSWLVLDGNIDHTIATQAVERTWAVFGGANLWIGALAGLLMLAAATWMRRWRDDS